jgi:hypothetical protein
MAQLSEDKKAAIAKVQAKKTKRRKLRKARNKARKEQNA